MDEIWILDMDYKGEDEWEYGLRKSVMWIPSAQYVDRQLVLTEDKLHDKVVVKGYVRDNYDGIISEDVIGIIVMFCAIQIYCIVLRLFGVCWNPHSENLLATSCIEIILLFLK